MRVDKILTNVDKAADYIPLASTIINLTALFIKCVVIPHLDEDELKNNHYYRHLDQKSAVRCIVLLIPVVGNIAVGIFDFISRNKEKSQSTSSADDLHNSENEHGTPPHLDHEDRPPALSAEDPPSSSSKKEAEPEFDGPFSALHHAVLNDKTVNGCKDFVIPFHRIFSYEGSEIFIGNETIITPLLRCQSDIESIKRSLNDKCPRFVSSVQSDEVDRQMAYLSKIDLMISFTTFFWNQMNSPTVDEGNSRIQNKNYPVEASDRTLKVEYLKPIFNLIDTALTQKQTVFLCSSKDTYAEVILVLYIAFKTNSSFDQALEFFSSKRAISSYFGTTFLEEARKGCEAIKQASIY